LGILDISPIVATILLASTPKWVSLREWNFVWMNNHNMIVEALFQASRLFLSVIYLLPTLEKRPCKVLKVR
jgi:hypothetical protein